MKALSFKPEGQYFEIIPHVPIPVPKEDEFLVRIKAYRFDVSVLMRHSFNGENYVEASGFIVSPSPSSPTTAVLLLLHSSDGVYSEYAVVQKTHVYYISSALQWDALAAIPRMLSIAWGALIRGLELKPREMLLIRGDDEIGAIAAAVGRSHGAYVVESSSLEKRKRRVEGKDEKEEEEEDSCTGLPSFDKILHLSPPSSLPDSFQCLKHGGMVCVVNTPGHNWAMESIDPVDMIPSEAKLTVYKPTIDQFMTSPLQALVGQVELGNINVDVGWVVNLHDTGGLGLLSIGHEDGKLIVSM